MDVAHSRMDRPTYPDAGWLRPGDVAVEAYNVNPMHPLSAGAPWGWIVK